MTVHSIFYAMHFEYRMNLGIVKVNMLVHKFEEQSVIFTGDGVHAVRRVTDRGMKYLTQLLGRMSANVQVRSGREERWLVDGVCRLSGGTE